MLGKNTGPGTALLAGAANGHPEELLLSNSDNKKWQQNKK